MKLTVESLKRIVKETLAESVGRVIFSGNGLTVTKISNGRQYLFRVGDETALLDGTRATELIRSFND